MSDSSIKGTFKGVGQAKLSKQSDQPELSKKINTPKGWFVISHRWISEKKERRLYHGKWFKIKNSAGGCVYRILRFSPNLKGSPKEGAGEIIIDWPAWLELSAYAEEVPGTMELTIDKVSWWLYPKMAMAHPDPNYRLAGELGVLSAILGILSVILAL